MLAVASDSRTVALWKVANRERFGQPLKLDRAAVSSLAFSPDGKLLALASAQVTRVADNKAILIDVSTLKVLGEFPHMWPVFTVAFSPDGRLLASASGYSGPVLWAADEQAWKRIACSVVNRNLSRNEWREFAGEAIPFQSVCPDLPEFTE